MNCLCVVLALVISQPKSKPKTPEPRVDLRCGGYCLYAGLSALDVPLGDYAALEKSLGEPSTLGYSMEQLARAARSRGAFALGVETNLDNLASRPGRFAGIALLDDAKHYACIYDVNDKSVFIVDPPAPARGGPRCILPRLARQCPDSVVQGYRACLPAAVKHAVAGGDRNRLPPLGDRRSSPIAPMPHHRLTPPRSRRARRDDPEVGGRSCAPRIVDRSSSSQTNRGRVNHNEVRLSLCQLALLGHVARLRSPRGCLANPAPADPINAHGSHND